MTQLDMFDQPSPEQSGLGTPSAKKDYIEAFYFLDGETERTKNGKIRQILRYTCPVYERIAANNQLARIAISRRALNGIILVSYGGNEPVVEKARFETAEWERLSLPWSEILGTLASWREARASLIADSRKPQISAVLDIFACVREGNFERLAMETT